MTPDSFVPPIRDASRRLVRELGFMQPTLAGTDLPPSAVHALIELGAHGTLTAGDLCELLNLQKSSVSRMTRKLIDAGELNESAAGGDGRVKSLSLTAQGRRTLAGIDAFARRQVGMALARIPAKDHAAVHRGLGLYADALGECRTGAARALPSAVTIEAGYRPGIVGRATEMHAGFYARIVGFGAYFEGRVAAGLAEFLARLDRPANGLWSAVADGRIIGTIAVDGEDLGPGLAHLRWFIMEDGRRGGGIGRRLLREALSFCDREGFTETQLWTFEGLEAARRLYEGAGFTLAEERPGRQWGEEVVEQRFVRRGAPAPLPS